MERFLGEVCTMEWHARHDAGEPMAETAAALKAEHPAYAEAIDAWRSRWDEMFAGPEPETAEMVARLAEAGVPQFALTNFPGEKWDAFCRDPDYGFLGHFEDVTVSGLIGARKPHREAFARAESSSGLAPADFLFIDDSPPNIEAARAFGYAAALFDSPASARKALRDHGLL